MHAIQDILAAAGRLCYGFAGNLEYVWVNLVRGCQNVFVVVVCQLYQKELQELLCRDQLQERAPRLHEVLSLVLVSDRSRSSCDLLPVV
eukprot:2905198-Rhodomonas_salina.1